MKTEVTSATLPPKLKEIAEAAGTGARPPQAQGGCWQKLMTQRICPALGLRLVLTQGKQVPAEEKAQASLAGAAQLQPEPAPGRQTQGLLELQRAMQLHKEAGPSPSLCTQFNHLFIHTAFRYGTALCGTGTGRLQQPQQ